MKHLAAILAFALGCIAAGCGPRLTSGTIISKSHSPGYMYMNYIVNADGTLTPYPVFIPDSWSVSIQGTAEGRELTQTFSVSESDYNQFKAGDTWP